MYVYKGNEMRQTKTRNLIGRPVAKKFQFFSKRLSWPHKNGPTLSWHRQVSDELQLNVTVAFQVTE